MYTISLVIGSIFIVHIVFSQDVPGLIVTTTQGQVRGVGATDGDYTMFMGIPYGKVVETNPFGVSTYYYIQTRSYFKIIRY